MRLAGKNVARLAVESPISRWWSWKASSSNTKPAQEGKGRPAGKRGQQGPGKGRGEGDVA